jgi:hypothetical protein
VLYWAVRHANPFPSPPPHRSMPRLAQLAYLPLLTCFDVPHSLRLFSTLVGSASLAPTLPNPSRLCFVRFVSSQPLSALLRSLRLFPTLPGSASLAPILLDPCRLCFARPCFLARFNSSHPCFLARFNHFSSTLTFLDRSSALTSSRLNEKSRVLHVWEQAVHGLKAK